MFWSLIVVPSFTSLTIKAITAIVGIYHTKTTENIKVSSHLARAVSTPYLIHTLHLFPLVCFSWVSKTLIQHSCTPDTSWLILTVFHLIPSSRKIDITSIYRTHTGEIKIIWAWGMIRRFLANESTARVFSRRKARFVAIPGPKYVILGNLASAPAFKIFNFRFLFLSP